MDTFRTLLATSFFLVGCYFAVSLIVSAFALATLFSALFAFIAAHFVMPSDYRRRENGWAALDWVVSFIELPYWCIVFIGRFLARIITAIFD